MTGFMDHLWPYIWPMASVTFRQSQAYSQQIVDASICYVHRIFWGSVRHESPQVNELGLPTRGVTYSPTNERRGTPNLPMAVFPIYRQITVEKERGCPEKVMKALHFGGGGGFRLIQNGKLHTSLDSLNSPFSG